MPEDQRPTMRVALVLTVSADDESDLDDYLKRLEWVLDEGSVQDTIGIVGTCEIESALASPVSGPGGWNEPEDLLAYAEAPPLSFPEFVRDWLDRGYRRRIEIQYDGPDEDDELRVRLDEVGEAPELQARVDVKLRVGDVEASSSVRGPEAGVDTGWIQAFEKALDRLRRRFF